MRKLLEVQFSQGVCNVCNGIICAVSENDPGAKGCDCRIAIAEMVLEASGSVGVAASCAAASVRLRGNSQTRWNQHWYRPGDGTSARSKMTHRHLPRIVRVVSRSTTPGVSWAYPLAAMLPQLLLLQRPLLPLPLHRHTRGRIALGRQVLVRAPLLGALLPILPRRGASRRAVFVFQILDNVTASVGAIPKTWVPPSSGSLPACREPKTAPLSVKG